MYLSGNPKRVKQLMLKMGLETIYTGPRKIFYRPGNMIYPCLFMGVKIDHPKKLLGNISQ